MCGVKPHVLRYWEQEFTQLRPMKRRGNRRYYQHHEVLMIRRIRDLLYDQGFTISGARNRLQDGPGADSESESETIEELGPQEEGGLERAALAVPMDTRLIRRELREIRELLSSDGIYTI